MDRATTVAAQRHVLVLEDDSSIAELLYWILTEAGYSVTCVERLDEARRICKESTPDMIIADLLLPDGLGSELLSEMGSERPDGHPPAIMMSALPQARHHAESVGAQLCLMKPFDLGEFLEAVSNLAVPAADPTIGGFKQA